MWVQRKIMSRIHSNDKVFDFDMQVGMRVYQSFSVSVYQCISVSTYSLLTPHCRRLHSTHMPHSTRMSNSTRMSHSIRMPHQQLGWKSLTDDVEGFGPTNPLTRLVPVLKDIDPDDAFSTVQQQCLLLYC
jgi:hypothetical protein